MTTSRVALVTGGGVRVGRAIAQAMAAAGYVVAVHYNASVSGAEETAAAIRAAGGVARPFGADLSDPLAPARLIDEVVGALGRLDVLVNSAAIMTRTPNGEVSAAQWDEMFAINVRAPYFLSQAAAPHLAAVGGSIVNIADHLTYDHEPDYIPHGITKAGVSNMTEALAATLAPGVRVNAVAPGVVLMPEWSSNKAAERFAATTPLQRLGTPEDVASAVIWLADARYVTGETIRVDGGRHLRR
jgi:pteridine reductase